MTPKELSIIAIVVSGFFSVLVAVINAPWVSDWIKDKRKKNKYTVYSHYKGQRKIDEALKNIALETGAHLVSVWGFENGTYFISGYPELFTSWIAQFPSPGASLDKGNGEHMIMPDLTDMFKRKRYSKFNRLFSALEDVEVEEYFFDGEHRFNDYQAGHADFFGIRCYYVFKIRDTRIRDRERQWVHTLAVGFNQEHQLNESQLDFIRAEIKIMKNYLLL